MNIIKIRKKEEVFEAIQWTGDEGMEKEVDRFIHPAFIMIHSNYIDVIPTRDYNHFRVNIGEYIIKDKNGYLSKFTQEIIDRQYEIINESCKHQLTAQIKKLQETLMFPDCLESDKAIQEVIKELKGIADGMY